VRHHRRPTRRHIPALVRACRADARALTPCRAGANFLPLHAQVHYPLHTPRAGVASSRLLRPSGGKESAGIIWAPDGRFAYVVNEGSNTVSVIDARANQVTATLPTGEGPSSIAVLPNGRQAYVSNLDSGTLTVLELTGG
jgi:YVTN family beta-propeller protein